MPGADVCWKLNCELALSAKSGLKLIRVEWSLAAIRLVPPLMDKCECEVRHSPTHADLAAW